jgi:ligand-binding sensor domain-containing protein
VAYDPGQRVVWLGTNAGTLHTFQVDFHRWRLEASPGVGPILAIVAVPGGSGEGVLARTPTGWYQVGRFGEVVPVPPDQVPAEAALRLVPPAERLGRLEPAYAASGPTLTADRGGRVWPLTDFVRGDRPSEYWLGTAGNNLYHYDARFYEARPLPFGLLTVGAGALAEDGNAIWIGGDGRGPRRGPVRATRDLQEWRQYESGLVQSPPERVEDLYVTADAIWFGAPSGLYRLDRQTDAWLQVGGLQGRLPVRRISPGRAGDLWVATDRGLVRASTDGVVEASHFQGRAVNTVLETGDGVWVGGEAGLVLMDRDGRVRGVTPGALPPPPGPIVDLALEDGQLWAATTDALWRFDGRGWEGPLREVAGNVGRLLRLRVTGDALWVTGTLGASRRMPDGSGWRTLAVERDLPAVPALDVLSTDEHVYVSTPAGVVRLERRRGY